MASRKQAQHESTDDWPQLRLALVWPEQHAYELIRPVVLFGRSPAERAQQTGVSERTIYRKRACFDTLAMVTEAERVETPYHSPQPPLWGVGIWRVAVRHPGGTVRPTAIPPGRSRVATAAAV